MSDFEMTKLCAEAMRLTISGTHFFADPEKSPHPHARCVWVREFHDPYDPLHDDAQAMALLKRFNLMVNWNSPTEVWCMPMDQTKYGHLSDSPNCSDLNRSIVECVAKMQEAKPA